MSTVFPCALVLDLDVQMVPFEEEQEEQQQQQEQWQQVLARAPKLETPLSMQL